MQDIMENLVKLASASSLVLVIILISHLRKIGIVKDFLSAASRGFIQLMLLSPILAYVFFSSIWFVYATPIIAVMALLAGYTSAKRAEASGLSKAILITTPSITIGALFSLSALTILKVIPIKPEFIIPLAGMAFGNAMNICSLTLTRLLGEIKNNRDKIEAMLALGASSDLTVKEFERIAAKWALIPNIDNLRTLGLIFIPGTMTGMLMAGIAPITAAVYQLSIFFMIISSGIITAVIAIHFTRARVFTPAHQLVDI
ncbi:MAG: iron export ABC transporter permease subunit FetB [Archaeoglobus sp.]|nr:iron export ABC transporter permease subunit FetB [Archaeoglobus sp.]